MKLPATLKDQRKKTQKECVTEMLINLWVTAKEKQGQLMLIQHSLRQLELLRLPMNSAKPPAQPQALAAPTTTSTNPPSSANSTI